MNNINITGTFTEYMDSVVAEIQQLLSDANYSVEVKNSFWGVATAKDGGTFCKVVSIWENDNGPGVCFSIAELEFLTLRRFAPEGLINIATTRLADVINIFKILHDAFGETIDKLRVGVS